MKHLPLTLCLGLFALGCQAAETDSRQTLRVSPAQKHLVLTEMRAMLAATQGMIGALAANDMASVALHARQVGMTMAHKAEDQLHGALPPAFMQLGMSVHQDFDQIAADAEAKRDSAHTLRQLGATMQKCVACHDTYQLQVTPAVLRKKPAAAP